MFIDIYVKMYSLRHSYENLSEFLWTSKVWWNFINIWQKMQRAIMQKCTIELRKKMDLKIQKARGVGIIMSSLKTAEEWVFIFQNRRWCSRERTYFRSDSVKVNVRNWRFNPPLRWGQMVFGLVAPRLAAVQGKSTNAELLVEELSFMVLQTTWQSCRSSTS